jgi:hypothetical protein
MKKPRKTLRCNELRGFKIDWGLLRISLFFAHVFQFEQGVLHRDIGHPVWDSDLIFIVYNL